MSADHGQRDDSLDLRHSLTDVGGIGVGHSHRHRGGWRTGTTVVVAPSGAVAGVDIRGGGPGTRETDALDPRRLVDRIHAVCLSGGSAYGLAAADGVATALEERGLGFPVPGGVVPVVPAAVIFDLGRAGHFDRRPDAGFGSLATRRALGRTGRNPERGAVGAGSGAIAGGLQGGVGMSSCRVGDIVVAALFVVNSSGSVINPETGLPWELEPKRLRTPSRTDRARLITHLDELEQSRRETTTTAPPGTTTNTTIGVVATTADLGRAEAAALASVAHDGIAIAVRPAHSMFDGDAVFALATGIHPLLTERAAPHRFAGTETRPGRLNELLEAAVKCTAYACADAVISATSLGPNGPPSYRDLMASAF